MTKEIFETICKSIDSSLQNVTQEIAMHGKTKYGEYAGPEWRSINNSLYKKYFELIDQKKVLAEKFLLDTDH